jgi:uncharacterized protein
MTASATSKFVWYDLMTTDMKAASAFYEKAIGWSIADSGMPGMEYSTITQGGKQVGGVMPLPPDMPDMPPRWNAYVGVTDVDAYAKKAAKLGATIIRAPMDIPGVGRFAVIADPSGATFLLFTDTSGMAPEDVPMGAVGHVAWRELMHDDEAKTWAFYSAMFGWNKGEAHDMGPMGIYQLFNTGGDPVGGMMKRGDGMPPANWQLYFGVSGADAAVARIKANGGSLLMGPMEVPGGAWVANCKDPQGALFSVFSGVK